MKKVKHPVLRYHGSKFRLASWVISHFKDHTCYVESFGGAAGVLMKKPQSYAEVYNDLDGDVFNLFKVLRDPESNLILRELCALTPYSREDFELAFTAGGNDIERARKMVVRSSMGFGTTASSGSPTGFRTDTKRKCATAQHLWERYPDNLANVGQRLQGVLIENKPAMTVAKKHDGEKTQHYFDPPYVMDTRVKGNRGYNHEMTDDDHLDFLKGALNLEGSIVISGYDTELYNDTLSSWNRHTKSSRISAGRGTGIRQEVIWVKP